MGAQGRISKKKNRQKFLQDTKNRIFSIFFFNVKIAYLQCYDRLESLIRIVNGPTMLQEAFKDKKNNFEFLVFFMPLRDNVHNKQFVITQIKNKIKLKKLISLEFLFKKNLEKKIKIVKTKCMKQFKISEPVKNSTKKLGDLKKFS